MIARTVLEWGTLGYGEDPSNHDLIPAYCADQLVRVAQSCSFGGKSGASVLEHGRYALRAKGIVGVLASQACSLEILPKIDVEKRAGTNEYPAIRQRLVHMLATVLNVKLDLGLVTELDWQNKSLLEVLIKMFVSKLIAAVKQGMPRRYVEHEDALTALRGSLNVSRQFTTQAVNPARLICRFDDLSEDIEINRVMKVVILRLLNLTRSIENQRNLKELHIRYADIAEVNAKDLRWDKIVIDRTNERWRELLELAKLFLGQRFQTTSLGNVPGHALLFDMASLFEEYIARLISKALRGTGSQAVAQGGRKYCLTHQYTSTKVFQTRPDVMIKKGQRVTHIVDTKWKLVDFERSDNKLGVGQADVYQMMAYSQLYECPRVTLLYPHHSGISEPENVHGKFLISGQEAAIEFASFDVATEIAEVDRIRALIS